MAEKPSFDADNRLKTVPNRIAKIIETPIVMPFDMESIYLKDGCGTGKGQSKSWISKQRSN